MFWNRQLLGGELEILNEKQRLMEKKRNKALDVTWAMQKLLSTPELYSMLKDVANEDDSAQAKSQFKDLCDAAYIQGDLRKYLWIILRDTSIRNAKGIDVNEVALDQGYCWSSP